MKMSRACYLYLIAVYSALAALSGCDATALSTTASVLSVEQVRNLKALDALRGKLAL